MLRAGLVGFGMAGRVFHAPLISSVEGLELSAVVERHTDQARQRYPGISTYRSLEDLLADASIDLARFFARVVEVRNPPMHPGSIKSIEDSASARLGLMLQVAFDLPLAVQ